jgi:predicted small secreted protein
MKHQGIHSVAIRIVYLIGVVAFTVFLGACNTMHGLGKDVERGGEHMEDAATKVQKKM